jgi:hypothetical protein
MIEEITPSEYNTASMDGNWGEYEHPARNAFLRYYRYKGQYYWLDFASAVVGRYQFSYYKCDSEDELKLVVELVEREAMMIVNRKERLESL